ncbi:ALBINO3-like protein 2, chloroplastic isoform X2 [Mangifera indica]|uniref:ALBINO3-like protein 2, chloroplastic isoform X2 n=1 Tax=Mangifera indica TaxID=29780 RepID=UPI001CFC1D42|nr:ALBINO3-like protein 2, chloroplastic isoform X2 [Mangifera indica]
MATPRLLLSHLRRFTRSPSHAPPLYHFLHASPPPPLPEPSQSSCFRHSSASSRFFHSGSVDDDSLADSFANSVPIPTDIVNFGDGVIGGGEELILPVRTLISVLDAYHNLSGFPWWVIIATSTLAFRLATIPVLVLQLKKMQKVGELFPKLPPPFPPSWSGRNFINQISIFRRKRKEIGCPSFLWFLATFSVQVPCFILGVTTIRRMSLDGHPGFDSGGTLWFQNLTEFPHGLLGSIFPILIAGLHYTNVQLSFRKSSLRKETGLLGLLSKYYKMYLDVLTVPLVFIGYCIPQGSLVYWVTNGTFSVIQQLSLKHPAVLAKLGLPDKDAPSALEASEKIGSPETHLDSSAKQRKISVKDLTPKELLALSVKYLSKGQKEKAIPCLQQALVKDPDYIDALILMGQTQLQNGLLAEAIEYLEHAISKGKMAEGIVHLERIANLKEPEEKKSKAHYYDGLVLLSSALSNVGRLAEAAKHLRLAAAYNPEYNELLQQCENELQQQCENDNGDFTSDLSSSRRGDY